MALYDFYGNIIVDPESQLMLKRNNETLVGEFLSVAQSYLGKTDIEYKDGDSIIWKSTATNGIDCSSYVALCLMGWPYEKTPYYTHQYIDRDTWEANIEDYSWTLSTVQYKLSRFIDGHNPDERMRLASQLGRWMESRGQKVPLTNGFRDVMPGDIVFWANKRQSTGDWSNSDWYDHISHIGIILSKENAPNTYVDDSGNTRTWDKDKYPFKHTIIEVTTTTPPCTTSRWLERKQEDPTYQWSSCVNTIVMICRPDLGAIQPTINE